MSGSAMLPTIRPPFYANTHRDLSSAVPSTSAVYHHPIRFPAPQLVSIDHIRRQLVEPPAPGSFIPLSPPPTKKFPRRPLPLPPQRESTRARGGTGPTAPAHGWGLDITTLVESLLESADNAAEEHLDDADAEEGVTFIPSAAPQLDVMVPSSRLSFYFDDTSSLPSTPALSTASLTSTPSTATFSLYSISDDEVGQSLNDHLSSEEDIMASYFSDDEDGDGEPGGGSRTPKFHRPHPSAFENFLPPIPNDIPSPATLFSPPTETYFRAHTNDLDSSLHVTLEGKRRKRHGRLMSPEDVHIVRQSIFPAEAWT